MSDKSPLMHWRHPPERERLQPRDPFDPVVEGARHQLTRELSLALWRRICGDAGTGADRLDAEQVRRRFAELAARVAAHGGRLSPEVGKLTRVGVELGGGRWTAANAGEHAVPPPGRQTLAMIEAQRWASIIDAAVVPRPRTAEGTQPHRAPLDPEIGARLSRAFGTDLTGVAVVADSPLATGSTKALAKDGEVHFRDGAYRPGTPDGDWLIAHELAHVVQQRGERGERVGTRKEIEREADRAATLATRGGPAAIQLRAQPAMAYAFSDSEAHDRADDVHADSGGAEPEDHAPIAEPAHNAAHAEPDAAHATSAAGPSADHAPDANHGASDDAHADHDEPSLVGEVSLGVVPAEYAPPGAPSVGGGPTAKPAKAPPNVAAAKPEVGLGEMRGVRPDKIGLLFGQVRTATNSDVAHERTALAANPPKQMSTGAVAAKAGAGANAKPGDAKATANRPGDKADTKPGDAKTADARPTKELPDHPVKGEVPGGEATKQAQQSQITAQQQQTVTQVITAARQSISSLFGSLFHRSAQPAAEANAPKMSDAETRQLAGSIDQLPTKASDVPTKSGPAPALAMTSEAKASADQNRAQLEAKTTQLETAGRADSQAPMGEDHIEPSAAPEELTATVAGGAGAGAGPATALPTVAGAAPTEEVGIIAQDQHGAEVDAALAKAGGEVTAERGKHAQEEAKARAESDAHIQGLRVKAEADQAAARTAAQAEVARTRSQWQAEIDKQGSAARRQANKKIADGMAQVQAEQTKANAEAKQHIDEGNRKAEDEKQKGEREAEEAKAKEKSSGFFGWVASKAKAAFDGIKKAVSAAIDACRKAVKAVLDAAKKLAMAAIDLARKAINATIKAIGQALIAISNVLLAAFPALKAKFQGLVKAAVDKATAAVNKLADGLKQAVQKALDLLGAALDKALQLLEKGINAVIDAANAVVQGAIKAAQAIADALGTWVALIKDIASAPGAWLGKLGAAVVDGIKNHLWSAFKTAVVEWFKSKVFELLGIGGIILQLLLDGGLTKDNITHMAMDALMVAIPAALIAILIEKLVAMIVPAAGAVMAVIEGLQAAWGTISRIIAAFGAFMAFLLAVKGGGAGPQFAVLLASAAVVVLDFVATWLLRKLASAARKVGAKLKGMAEKFKAKRKAKKDARAATKKAKAEAEPHGSNGKKTKGKDDDHNKTASEKERKKKEEKDKKNREILARAKRELPPKINAALAKRPGMLWFKAQLLLWKTQYRLTALSIKDPQNKHFRIQAKVNPEEELAEGYKYERADLLKMLEDVANEVWDKHFRTRALKGHTDAETAKKNREQSDKDLERMAKDSKAHGAKGGTTDDPVYLPTKPSDDLRLAAANKNKQEAQDVLHGPSTKDDASPTAQTRQKEGGGRFTETVNPTTNKTSDGLNYDEIIRRLKDDGHTTESIGAALKSMQTGGGIPPKFAKVAKEMGLLRNLMFNVEVQRKHENLIFSAMAHDSMQRGTDIKDLMTRPHGEGLHPATPTNAAIGYEPDHKQHSDAKKKFLGHGDKDHGDQVIMEARAENRRRQIATLRVWFQGQLAEGVPVAPGLDALKQLVRDWVERYYQLHPPDSH